LPQKTEKSVVGSLPDYDNPYPLKRLFQRRVLPLFLLLAVAFCVAAGFGGTNLMQKVYLEFASRRAQIVHRAVMQETPAPWQALANGALPEAVFSTPSGQKLLDILHNEEVEMSLSRLQIYGPEGVVVYSTDEKRIGFVDSSPAYRSAMYDNKRSVVRKPARDGSDLYELYVPVDLDAGGRIVIELYEPVGVLDSLLLKIAGPAFVVPLLFLAMIAFAINELVVRAQGDIDWRTGQLARLGQQLERFVSRSTMNAARQSMESEDETSRKIDCTLLMTDIRNFTAYSEERPPEEVVEFLNLVMSVQVKAISHHGGDVDKMIGDAVLARFDGLDRERRAVDAAVQLLEDLAVLNLPRQVGVGIYSGPVISGAIGPENRQDFTVIGDSVNVAARLCSAAGPSELVVDTQTLRTAGVEPGITEQLTLKGRRQALEVQRRTIAV